MSTRSGVEEQILVQEAIEEEAVAEETVEGLVLAELAALRSAIPGVHASLVATSDGLLVAHDLPDEDGPAQLGALSSTLLALARHAVELTGRGRLLDAAIRGSTGYFVTYAVGETAVLAVLGRADLNLAMLHIKTRPVVERVAGLADRFERFYSIDCLVQAGPEDKP